jgi:peptidoglycan-associated lipoprotein
MQRAKVWSWWLTSVVLIIFTLSGCPKKAPPPTESGLGTGTGGLGTSGTGAGESDLQGQDQAGRVERNIQQGPERGGPLQDIHFDYDSFEVSSTAREALRVNADWLQNNAQAKVEIEGHCDERGTVEYNLALGAKRAKAARDYLVTLGISPSRLSTISYGEELPLCQDADESCWQQNRRAHFTVTR